MTGHVDLKPVTSGIIVPYTLDDPQMFIVEKHCATGLQQPATGNVTSHMLSN